MTSLIEQRIARVRRVLKRQRLEALLVLIEENRKYLSGFTDEDTQFDESAGALLISAQQLILATDSRFELQAREEAPRYRVVCYREGLAKELPGLIRTLKIERLGYESRRMSCSQHRAVVQALGENKVTAELIAADDVVEGLRIRKARIEVSAIRRALVMAETVFDTVIQTIRPGMTEAGVAWEIEKKLKESGAEGLSFPSIVASGPNSARPHAIPGPRRIQAGEPVLFDWGIRLGGYCSDISRTVVIGKPLDPFEKVYRIVRDAQRRAIDAIRPGVSAKAIDAVARRHIERKGYKGFFGHGLGHGVGLAIHEAPRISPLSDAAAESGMVFTVEPGIYLPGWGGIRIENMVYVGRSGVEVLNRLGTDRFRIEA